MTAAHMTDDIDWRPADGWYTARCSCGWSTGPFPDLETMVDALMDHAALAATPPGDREAKPTLTEDRLAEALRDLLNGSWYGHEAEAAATIIARLAPEEAAVATAEAAAGEEGS